MSTTRQLPRSEWKAYFDRFTREHLKNDPTGAATVEVLSPTLGDQFEASGVPLLGLTYDPKSQAVEVLLEDVDHLVFYPTEIWVLEGEPGLIATIEIVQADGTKELLYVRTSDAASPHAHAP